ncbi:hypothetical protein FH972_010360 [Carpinus fangiana]|uniref:Uncharacterized protein n=1 Tax=Carpinus fangiana TaxID=176857 RepID=A0A660KN27_9ROSI|nr:hypothetical protein FH972_010360 [Carpinus fangiana]
MAEAIRDKARGEGIGTGLGRLEANGRRSHDERKGLKPRIMVWHRVTSLENRMMYLSPGGSFLEPAVATRTSNKIYMPMIQDNKNVFYSFDTAMYHIFFHRWLF